MSVPKYVFDKDWADRDFLIPSDKSIRIKLRQELNRYSRTEVMFLQENKDIARMVRARLAALEAYDKALDYS